jgi:hypothetical protein
VTTKLFLSMGSVARLRELLVIRPSCDVDEKGHMLPLKRAVVLLTLEFLGALVGLEEGGEEAGEAKGFGEWFKRQWDGRGGVGS